LSGEQRFEKRWMMKLGVTNMSLRLASMAAVMTLVCAGLAARGDALPKPAPMPSTQPTTSPTEELFYTIERTTVPGTRIWSMGCKGDMWVYGTSESVGDGAGMKIYVPAGGETNFLCSYDTGTHSKAREPNVTGGIHRKRLCGLVDEGLRVYYLGFPSRHGTWRTGT
jgi:hypothetical protein